MSSPTASLLTLPPEIRAYIYRYYFQNCDGHDSGYVYNHRTGKLRTVGNKVIELSLMYSCRLIFGETRHLPLQLNTIKFTTGCRDASARRLACDFHFLMDDLSKLHQSLAAYMDSCLTPAVCDTVTGKYPQLVPVIDAIRDLGDYYPCMAGEVPSVKRDAFRFLLDTAAEMQMECFRSEMSWFIKRRAVAREPPVEYNPYALLSINPNPWDLPTEQVCERLAGALKLHGRDPRGKMPTIGYRYSAAAVAINFLKSLRPSSRLAIRRILLCEDSRGVASSACHARGLIPFCKENPRLRVKRRVSLWRCVFQYESCEPKDQCAFGRSVACWLVEAHALSAAGMPPDSFTFILDGEVGRNEAALVFDRIIQWNMAYQQALLKRFDKKGLGVLPSSITLHRCFLYTDFPLAMEQFSQQSGMFRRNFCTGKPLDVEDLFQSRQHWSLERWLGGWYRHCELDFEVGVLATRSEARQEI